MSERETVTMANTSSIWGLAMVDPIVGNEYENLRVSDAEIVGEPGAEKLRIEFKAEVIS